MSIQNENMTVFISSIKTSLHASSEALKQMKSKYAQQYKSPGFSATDAILAIDLMLEYNTFFQQMLVQLQARDFSSSDTDSRAYQYIYLIYLKKKKQTLELENDYIQIFELLSFIIENKDLNSMGQYLKFQGTFEEYIGKSLIITTYGLTFGICVFMTALTLVLAELFAPYALAVVALILLICIGQMIFTNSSSQQNRVSQAIFFGTILPSSFILAHAPFASLSFALCFPGAIAIGILSAFVIGKPFFFLGEAIEASGTDKVIQSRRILAVSSSAESWHQLYHDVNNINRRHFFFKTPRLQEDFETGFNLALTKSVPCV